MSVFGAFRRTLTRLRTAEAGGVLVSAAIALPVLMVMGGGAIDLHRRDSADKRLQDAMDAAVLSGAAASASGDATVAEAAFAANGGPELAPAVFTAEAGEVTGSATGAVATSFLGMIGIGSLPIRADALAVTGTMKPCVLMLEPTGAGLVANSSSSLDAQACSVHVNSTNTRAVEANNSTLRTQSLCVRGGAYRGGSGQIIPSARTGCAALADPLAGLPEPTVSGTCTSRSASSGQTINLSPGCYTNVTASSGGRINLAPGLYRITGRLEASNDGYISGSNVTLYLSGAGAQVIGNSDVDLHLSASTTGPYAGIVLFQTRTASQASSQGLVVNSGVRGALAGVIYMPHTNFVLNSDVGASASYTMLIGRSLSMSNSARLTINDAYDGPIPLPTNLLSVRLES
jgi:hypothetical protein